MRVCNSSLSRPSETDLSWRPFFEQIRKTKDGGRTIEAVVQVRVRQHRCPRARTCGDWFSCGLMGVRLWTFNSLVLTFYLNNVFSSRLAVVIALNTPCRMPAVLPPATLSAWTTTQIATLSRCWTPRYVHSHTHARTPQQLEMAVYKLSTFISNVCETLKHRWPIWNWLKRPTKEKRKAASGQSHRVRALPFLMLLNGCPRTIGNPFNKLYLDPTFWFTKITYNVSYFLIFFLAIVDDRYSQGAKRYCRQHVVRSLRWWAPGQQHCVLRVWQHCETRWRKGDRWVSVRVSTWSSILPFFSPRK